jgi:hypothetical protein
VARHNTCPLHAPTALPSMECGDSRTLEADTDFKSAAVTGTVQAAASSMRTNEGTWKLVTDAAGIGKALGVKLEAAGYTRLYNLLGQYLSLNLDKEDFLSWLEEVGGSSMSRQNRVRCWAGIAKYVADNM